MGTVRRDLSNTFQRFFDSEKFSGILLIVCTVISLLITNSSALNRVLRVMSLAPYLLGGARCGSCCSSPAFTRRWPV